MSYNIASSWRGVVGVTKPVPQSGSLEEFIRLLPEGIGVIPSFYGITTGTKKELFDALDLVKEKIAELAELKVDLIHPEGAPIFMLHGGYKGEKKIIKDLEEKHGIPIVTTLMTMVETLKALNVRRMVGLTYDYPGVDKQKYEKYFQYFSEAGIELLEMQGVPAPSFAEVRTISYKEVYQVAKQLYLKHKNAQGIYILGSLWRILEVIHLLEQDLQVPVAHPIPARVWAIQKRLYVRQPVKGYGRLLEEMP
jgi:maleate cis-trans isomerase